MVARPLSRVLTALAALALMTVFPVGRAFAETTSAKSFSRSGGDARRLAKARVLALQLRSGLAKLRGAGSHLVARLGAFPRPPGPVVTAASIRDLLYKANGATSDFFQALDKLQQSCKDGRVASPMTGADAALRALVAAQGLALVAWEQVEGTLEELGAVVKAIDKTGLGRAEREEVAGLEGALAARKRELASVIARRLLKASLGKAVARACKLEETESVATTRPTALERAADYEVRFPRPRAGRELPHVDLGRYGEQEPPLGELAERLANRETLRLVPITSLVSLVEP